MAVRTCIGCGDTVTMQLSGSAPYAALATLEPLSVLCRGCSKQLALVNGSGSRKRIEREGKRFIELGTAFVHSGHPKAAHIYNR